MEVNVFKFPQEVCLGQLQCRRRRKQIILDHDKKSMVPASKTNANPKLEASVLRLFPHNGYDWETSSPPWEWEEQFRPHPNPVYPIFPNGDSLTWMALAIIEQAQRQINDHSYWKENFSYVPRDSFHSSYLPLDGLNLNLMHTKGNGKKLLIPLRLRISTLTQTSAFPSRLMRE